jgi:hypothetical protein
VKPALQELETRGLPNNLLALLPLGALLPDFTPATVALLPAATDPMFDASSNGPGSFSGLPTTAQVISAQPLTNTQPNPTVIAPAINPAASPAPADLAFQSGFPDQAAGLMSDAAFSSLLDAASAFPASPTASPASPPQPAGAAARSSASPAFSSATPRALTDGRPSLRPGRRRWCGQLCLQRFLPAGPKR